MLAGGVAAWPIAARGQQRGKVATIGFLGPATSSVASNLVAAFVVLALGGVLTGGGAVSFVWRIPLAALLFGATIWVVGRWAPSKRRPIKWVSFGSAITVVAWLIASAAYGVWVTQVSSVGSAFGSLAAVFVFIVFTHVSCVVYLAGAVVDASVREEATGGEA